MTDSDHQLGQIMHALLTLAWSASPDGSADFLNLFRLEYAAKPGGGTTFSFTLPIREAAAA